MLLVAFALFIPNFVAVQNLLNVLRSSSYLVILAAGQMLVLIVGGFDLSQGAVVALTSVSSALVMVAFKDTFAGDPGLIILVGVLPAWDAAPSSGCERRPRRVPADFSVHGYIGHHVDRHRICAAADQRNSGLRHAEELCRRFRPRSVARFAHGLLSGGCRRRSHLGDAELHAMGRYILAIGGNIQAAIVSGVPAKTYLILSYVICSMLASVSGLALTAQIGSGQAVINAQLTLESIAAAVIAGVSIKGGVGRVEMVALGAILLLTLTDAMDLLRIDPSIQAILLGIIVVLAVALDELSQRRAALAAIFLDRIRARGL